MSRSYDYWAEQQEYPEGFSESPHGSLSSTPRNWKQEREEMFRRYKVSIDEQEWAEKEKAYQLSKQHGHSGL